MDPNMSTSFGSWVEGAHQAWEAWDIGTRAGEFLEDHFHLGSQAGHFVYDISNPHDVSNAAHHYDAFSSDMASSHYGDAAHDGAATLGSMVDGVLQGYGVHGHSW